MADIEERNLAAQFEAEQRAMKEKTMHTPKEWGIMRDGPKGDGKPWEAHMETAPGLTIGCSTNTEPICRVSGYLMPAEANARLIAAAPQLLEALEGLADTMCDYPLERATGSDVADAIDKARASIQAAKETA